VHKLDVPAPDLVAAVPDEEAPPEAVTEGIGPVAPEELIISRHGEVIGRACLDVRTLVGRSAHNDICLNHPKVSRHHAVIVGTPDGHYIVDLNSKNGLIVNGERAASAILLDGDVIAMGPYRLKFVARGSVSNGDPRPGGLSLSRTATMRASVLPDVSLRRVN
jgi:pSer/pThr/pTyr-binding forkhead associated (FHA) protein